MVYITVLLFITVVFAAVAWVAIGAGICWTMTGDIREC